MAEGHRGSRARGADRGRGAARGHDPRERADGEGLHEARKQHGDSDLLGEIAATPPQLETREFKSAEELRDEGLARIRESVALVEVKATPDEVEAYKNFILAVAKRAAEATKSGGFLGIGGDRVSENEKEALGQLAEALGLPAPTE